MEETNEEREQRKDMYISSIAKLGSDDEDQVLEEASNKWEEVNSKDSHSPCTPEEPCQNCEGNTL